MAVVHIEGFRNGLGVGSNTLPTVAWSLGANAALTRQAGRNAGTYGVSSSSTGTGSSSYSQYNVALTGAAAAFNMSYGFSALATKGVYFGAWGTSSSDIFYCTHNTALTIAAASSTAAYTIYNSSPIDMSVWHWYSLIGRFHDAAAGWAQLYIDGILYAERATGDALPGSGYYQGCFINLGNTGVSASNLYNPTICDFVIRNDSTKNAPVPQSRVDVLVPNSDAAKGWATSSGTDHYPLVADASTEPNIDGSTYISAAAAGLDDTFGFQDMPFTPAKIDAVQTKTYLAALSSGSPTVAPLMNGAAGSAVSPTAVSMLSAVYELDGGSAWTKASVDAVVAGVRSG
jgi:hypothetical protein